MASEESTTCSQIKEEPADTNADVKGETQKEPDDVRESQKSIALENSSSVEKTESSVKEDIPDENLKASSEQELFLDLCPGVIDELDASFTVLDDCEDTREQTKIEPNPAGDTKKEVNDTQDQTERSKTEVKEEKSVTKEVVPKNNELGESDNTKIKVKEVPTTHSTPVNVKGDKEQSQQEKQANIQTAKLAERRRIESISGKDDERPCNSTRRAVSESDSLIINVCDVDLDNDTSVSSFCSGHNEKNAQKTKSLGAGNNEASARKRIKIEVKNQSTKTDKCQESVAVDEKNSAKDSFDDEKTPKKKDATASAKQKSNLRCLWVTNIAKTLKASILKQCCLKYGKVQSAKIVTDGKNLFGYVLFDKYIDASECLKKMDGTVVEGTKITLSFTKPQAKPPKLEVKETKQSPPQEEKAYVIEDRKTIKKITNKDPLTTKFVTEQPRKRNYSRENDIHREYLREKRERERLRRLIMEQEEQQREERRRQRKREEEQRQLEWKLKQDRRKLEMERELLEKERKAMQCLELERRKIEEEKKEMSREKAKLEAELRNARKLDSKKRKCIDRDDNKRKKVTVKSKISENSYKSPAEHRRYQDHYKPKHHVQEFPRAPPAPKLSEPAKVKPSREYGHRHPETRSSGDFASKIGSYDRKFECRKIEPIFTDRKAEFSGRKVVSDRFDIKSHRDFRRDSNERRFAPDYWKLPAKSAGKPWEVPVHQDLWKVGCSSGIPPTAARYDAGVHQESTYVPDRCDGYYYHHHPPPLGTEFARFEQYSQANRKY